MNLSSEKIIERSLNKAIKDLGGWSIKLLSSFIKGLPDRVCLLPKGKIIFVEVKSTGKKPTKAQQLVHKRLTDLGFKVYVIDKIHDIDELVNQIHWDYRYNS